MNLRGIVSVLLPNIEEMQTRRDVRGLVRVLQHRWRGYDLRKAAAQALGEIADSDAVPALTAVLEASRELLGLREAASVALERIGLPVHPGSEAWQIIWALELRGYPHRWDGCMCAVCGKQRDQDHRWEHCHCARCGATRNEEHKWVGCRCSICGRSRDAEHQMQGCRCTVCGHEEHRWHGCQCIHCGASRDEAHTWDGGHRCTVCQAVDLLSAAMAGDHAAVSDALSAGQDPEGTREPGRTALTLAAEQGHVVVVELLLGHGADVTVRDDAGATPLHRAARQGHLETVELLLAHGAHLDAGDREGRTPLYEAARHYQSHVVEFLVARGARGGELEIPWESLMPFCPSCGSSTRPKGGPIYSSESTSVFRCEQCGAITCANCHQGPLRPATCAKCGTPVAGYLPRGR